ncbi:MAG: hypothetical protein N2691_04835 [Patescibacteria group bacterium]|nr:hypothetical protein [Patescibacteria group bacterium]
MRGFGDYAIQENFFSATRLSNGKIIAVGSQGNASTSPLIVRYTASGVLEASQFIGDHNYRRYGSLYDVTPTSDGGFVAAGQGRDSFGESYGAVVKFNSSYNIQYVYRLVDAAFNSVIETQEGETAYIYAAGNTIDNYYIVAKIQTSTHATIWIRKFKNNNIPGLILRLDSIILARDDSGDVIVAGSTYDSPSGDRDVYVARLKKTDGSVVVEKYISGNFTERFYNPKIIAKPGTSGYIIAGSGYVSSMARDNVLLLDLDNSLNLSSYYAPGDARYNYGKGVAVAVENDGIVVVAQNTEVGGMGNTGIRIIKYDLSFNPVWQKELWNSQPGNPGRLYANSIVALPDGYLIAGAEAVEGMNNGVVLRTDAAGNTPSCSWYNTLTPYDRSLGGSIRTGGVVNINAPNPSISISSGALFTTISGTNYNICN